MAITTSIVAYESQQITRKPIALLLLKNVRRDLRARQDRHRTRAHRAIRA
jgi:hypothetical protein